MAVPTLEQLRMLVGNPHAYSVQQDDGSYRPVREDLTDDVLRAHLGQGITVGTYIGHVVDGRTVSRTLCLDVDSGSRTEAVALMNGLRELDVPSDNIGIEESGRKGYHVWLPLAEYTSNADLRRLGRAALLLAGVDCEIYPKQDEVRDLGNLVKLPGSLHRVTGRLASFLTAVPQPLSAEHFARIVADLPQERAKSTGSPVRYTCMAAIQEEGVEEGGRNNQLFHLATMLRRAGVSDDNVAHIIERTNELGDPLDSAEIDALLESSKASGPICSSIPAERHCGEACVTARSGGLSARQGQLKHAGVGERVVVQVTDRHGNIVELEHPDAGRIKGVINGE